MTETRFANAVTSRRVGLPPGTILVAEDAHDLQLRVTRYAPDLFEEIVVESVEALAEQLARGAPTENGTVWVDVVGHGDAERLRRLGEVLGLHPLALEDVANVDQRTKVELYGEDLLLFFRRAYTSAPGSSPLTTEQLGLLLRRGLVVTFQERPGDDYDPVRYRLRAGNPRIRPGGSGYLAYALLDAEVDHENVLLDAYYEAIEDLEEEILDDPARIDLGRLHGLRRDLVRLGRLAAPLRDLIGRLHSDAESEQSELISKSTALFLRDCHDHAVRVVERIDTGRDLAAGLVDLHLSMVGFRTNEVTQVLTLVATIFIPLSFLAGLYGMNFDTSSPWNMPELSLRYGYPTLLGIMISTGVGLVWYFRRRGWF